MKKLLTIISVLAVSVVAVVTVLTIGKSANQLPAGQTILYNEEADTWVDPVNPPSTTLPLPDELTENLRPFNYTLKEKYTTYGEVVEELDNLEKAGDEYEDYIYYYQIAYGINRDYGENATQLYKDFDMEYEKYHGKLLSLMNRIKPTEEEKTACKERLLKHYYDIDTDPVMVKANPWDNYYPSDEILEQMEKTVEALEQYEAGEITIDEALINANVIGRMRKKASKGYPMTWLEDVRISTSWFKLSDYDSYFD